MARVELPKGLIQPIPMKYEELESGVASALKFKQGELYTLKGEECDEFAMPERIYMCKGFVKEVNGISLDSVIMKQVDGPTDTVFSLTKLDCRMIGVTYESGLQLFPSNFSWNKVGETQQIREYTPKNLATYAPSPIDGTIRKMHLFIGFCQRHDKVNMITPYQTLMPIQDFFGSMSVVFRDERLRREHPLIIKPVMLRKDGDIFEAHKNGVNVMLFLSSGNSSGIDPREFEGKNIDDLISITWEDPIKSNYVHNNQPTHGSWLATEEQLNAARARLNKAFAEANAARNQANNIFTTTWSSTFQSTLLR